MNAAAYGAIVVLSALASLLIGVRALLTRGLLGAESARKVVHVGMGLVALPLPWFFSNATPVWIFAALTLGVLAMVRFLPAVTRRFGAVLGSTGRISYGEFYYSLGVALAFTRAHDNRSAYVCAIGILAFADTAGALVGARFGKHRYTIFGHTKSFEGSAAVLIVSALVLSVAGAGTLALLLAVAAIATLIEAVCSRGFDNLLLPVITAAMLQATGAALMHAALVALWIVIPMLVAGLLHVAVIKARLFPRLAAVPLDFGATVAGRAWFGENKTLRGALVMIGASITCFVVYIALTSQWPWARDLIPSFARAHPLAWGALAGAGYIAGELPNSFVKRRLGIEPGAPARGRFGATFWFVDQIDSMIGVVAFLLPVWQPTVAIFLALVGWTLCVHPAVAFVMLCLGLKTRVG